MRFFSKRKRIILFIVIPALLVGIFLISVVTSAATELNNTLVAAKINKDGQMEEKIENHDHKNNVQAKYVGVDDTSTALSDRVLKALSGYSDSHNPFYNGYAGLCELFCADIYRKAGYTYAGACCAYRHSINYATKEGKIPKGALIFSGIKPDGTLYENDHRASAYCDVCNSYAGHVAIYIGNGKVAGSQVPFIWDIDTWIEVFGYGGWSEK